MMDCRENLPYFIEYHPYHESINKKIIDEIITAEYPLIDATKVRNRDGGISNLRALTTQYNLSKSSGTLEVLYGWIISILSNNYRGWKFKVYSSWIGKYNKEHYTVSHNHRPTFISFVYFIKCPKGSSPLVFTTSGKRIKAEEGKLVMFPGYLRHHVPKNKCDDRIVLAGNILPISE